MMRFGKETGNLINHLYSRIEPIEPQIGMGATVIFWTDRRAGTIIEVADNSFVVQEDIATRTDGRGMSDSQSYDYKPNHNGARYTFKKVARGNAKGSWREGGRKDGSGVMIGKRDEYFDFGF